MQVNNNHKKRTGLIVTTGIIGAGAGAVYARNHLSDARVKQIQDLEFNIPDYYKNLGECFDVKKAETEFNNGKINKEEFEAVKGIQDKFVKASKDDSLLKEVINTPHNERTISYNEALKNANKSRFEMLKANLAFPKGLAAKLNEVGIFNHEKWIELANMQKTKVKHAFKIMSKPILIGVGIGAAAGVLVATGIKSMLNGN